MAGILISTSAYLIWGMAPLFWRALKGIPPVQLLAIRICFAFLVLAIILSFQGRWREVRQGFSDRKNLIFILGSTVMVGGNWLIYMHAVLTDRVLETSLGYYINPLISILLGFIFLKERLTLAQVLAVALAALGVMYMVFEGGSLPWMSLTIAFSFGFYGLLRKTAKVAALPGLTMETMILLLPAATYFVLVETNGSGPFLRGDWDLKALLLGTGLITALPLLLFGVGVRMITLRTMGFLQYIAPTATFLLCIFVFEEPFSQAQWVAFFCIWSALAIYTLEQWFTARLAAKAGM